MGKMSSVDEHINKIYNDLRDYKGGINLTAYLAGVSRVYVSDCFRKESHRHLPSAERIFFAASLAMKMRDEMAKYDEDKKAERLAMLAK